MFFVEFAHIFFLGLENFMSARRTTGNTTNVSHDSSDSSDDEQVSTCVLDRAFIPSVSIKDSQLFRCPAHANGNDFSYLGESRYRGVVMEDERHPSEEIH